MPDGSPAVAHPTLARAASTASRASGRSRVDRMKRAPGEFRGGPSCEPVAGDSPSSDRIEGAGPGLWPNASPPPWHRSGTGDMVSDVVRAGGADGLALTLL